MVKLLCLPVSFRSVCKDDFEYFRVFNLYDVDGLLKAFFKRLHISGTFHDKPDYLIACRVNSECNRYKA